MPSEPPTVAARATDPAPDPPAPSAGTRPGWRRWRGWIEAAVLFVAYECFEAVRARVQGSPGPSLRHAAQVVR